MQQITGSLADEDLPFMNILVFLLVEPVHKLNSLLRSVDVGAELVVSLSLFFPGRLGDTINTQILE